MTDNGSRPAIGKALTAGWDEEDDRYAVRVFTAKDAAMARLHERAAFYREEEEPPYDEDDDEDEDEEWADEEWNANEDGSGANNSQRQG
ncbi:MAG: hypothetical protein MI924_14365 [Chloroflexales bacterium]|nr:hypothetical protein [Chloroflexales bacterium]